MEINRHSYVQAKESKIEKGMFKEESYGLEMSKAQLSQITDKVLPVSTPFKAKVYRKMVERFEETFPAPLMPTLVFGNHDRTRVMTRLKGSVEKAKLLAMFQFTARGIPFTYFGEEIGIPNVRIPLKKGKDALAIQNKKVPQFLVNMSVETINRDECRTPMLWTAEANAEFCDAAITPWLPVSSNFKTINIEQQHSNPISQLNFYKKVIHLRKQTPALQEGTMEIADNLCSKKIFAYYRIHDNKKYLVSLNMSKSTIKIPTINGKLLLATHTENNANKLKAYEGRVILME